MIKNLQKSFDFFLKPASQFSLYALPYVWVLAYFLLSLELVSFSGFVKKYFLVDVRIVILMLLALLILISLRALKTRLTPTASTLQFVFLLNRLLFVPLVISSYLLAILEQEHFPNYVFSQFHIIPANLAQIVTLNTAVIVFDIFLNYVVTYNKKLLSKTSFLQFAFIVTVFTFFIPQLKNTILSTWVNTAENIKHLDWTQEEKLVAVLGGNQGVGWVATYGSFINKNTPESASIFIPPQIPPWLMEGNQQYFRWFVYPRNLETSRNEQASIPDNVDYVLIAHGTWGWGAEKFGWPQISIPKEMIKRIVIIDRKTLQITTLPPLEYVHDSSSERWGIIELVK